MTPKLNIVFLVIFAVIVSVTMIASQAFARDTLSHFLMWAACGVAFGGFVWRAANHKRS